MLCNMVAFKNSIALADLLYLKAQKFMFKELREIHLNL